MKQQRFNNKQGFTILEVVISLAILSIGATAVVSLMNSYSSQIRNTEVKSGFESATSQNLAEVSQMITNTAADNGSLVNGLCSFMKSYNTSAGLGFIYVELPSDDPFVTPTWGWAKTFPSASWASYECSTGKDSKGASVADAPTFAKVPNVWQRCFKPLNLESAPPYGLPAGLTNNPIFRVFVTPVRVRVEGKTDSKGNKITTDEFKGYQAVTLPKVEKDKLDARDTAFLVTSEVSYQQSSTDTSRSYQRQSLIHWFGEFQCHKFITTTKKLVLRPSGFGSGDDTSSLFSASQNSNQTVLEGYNRTNVFTEGVVKQERALTLLDKQKNLAAAGCIEKPVFNCKFKRKDKSVWKEDSLAAILGVRYNPNNAITRDSSLFAKPTLSLRSLNNNVGTNKDSIGLNSTFTINSANRTSGYTFTATRVNLESSVASPGDACSQVCTVENKFNEDTNPYGLNYSFTDNSKNVFDVKDQNSRVGCVCCYGKQCGAIGTKMQSWCSAQPDEAVDSRVPECAADYSNPATNVGLKDRRSLKGSSTNSKLDVSVSSADQDCLVGTKGSDQVSVSTESCASKLPVLCFAQGRFMLSKKSYTREQASQACYDLSYESVLASEVDERMMTQSGTTASTWKSLKTYLLPPVSGDRYKFRNAAMAGIFIAPQENAQLSSVIGSSDDDIAKSKKFWIALRTNEKADVVSSVPLIPSSISEYISHFDGMGNLVFLRELNTCNARYPLDCLPYTPAVSGPVVLHHARTRFGAAVVNSADVKGSFSALCWNPQENNFIRTSTTTNNYKDSFALCMRQKGVFLAPVRPLQWIASLLLAKKSFPQLPFPVYGKDESLATGTLWTGLEKKDGKYRQILPDKPSDSCLVDKEFKAIPFDAKSQTPEPKYHIERVSNKLVLLSGSMSEPKDLWIESEEDLLELSKQIFEKNPENIQFKECAKPVPGACGSANGVAVATAPSANLCSEGTASSVNGTGPWDWKCQGSPNTTAVSCSAPKSEVAASSSCPTPPEKVYTNTISRFGGRYAGTYDDYRGGGFNGVSTSSSINRLCSNADSNWIGAGGEVAGSNYQCLASSAPTRSFHNGGSIDSNGGRGQGWCQSTAVEWVKCKCK